MTLTHPRLCGTTVEGGWGAPDVRVWLRDGRGTQQDFDSGIKTSRCRCEILTSLDSRPAKDVHVIQGA
jgi:hypothetical protein